uniref:Odorant receptor n=1 Tax=Glyphodes pyloalis TaxID=1242752 RepID=A0A6M3GUG2_GLYPY|nr:olfactory receptor [Glyphodes pyloalis]
MQAPISYSTFRAFQPHFNSLARVGYFKLVKTPSSPRKLVLHNWYRALIWFFVLSYNLQHVIKVIQTRNNTDRMMDILYILLTTLNTLGKQVALNARVGRVDRIIAVINGSHFAPKNPVHVEILKENEKAMARLLALFQTMVLLACFFFGISPTVNKAIGQEIYLQAYFPFDTSGSPVLEIAMWYLSFNLTVQAWGNSTMDCMVAAFYSMAKTQLRLLRYNLEHLVDLNNRPDDGRDDDEEREPYNDSRVIQERLKQCVLHHRQILWFMKEVESIFCESMTVQFLVMAWVICMTMYKIVGFTIVSAELVTTLIYLNCMLSQLFIYCYFGSQVKVESDFVSQSVYCSKWTRLSPKFRRQLLVLMQCSLRPIMPCAAKIVPISLETYIAVLKASYTLFTILDKK